MKKTFIFIIAFSLLIGFTMSSCSNQNEMFNHISQIRSDCFVGQNDDFQIKIYCEQRETPFINDGYATTRENYLIVFVLNCDKPNLNINLNYNDLSYSLNPKFNVVTSCLEQTIAVSSFPQNTFSCEVVDTSSVIITLNSIKKSGAISPFEALSSIKNNQLDFINTLSTVQNYEIYIRLICEKTLDYYYVGFAFGNEKISAFLLDALSGEIIATRL